MPTLMATTADTTTVPATWPLLSLASLHALTRGYHLCPKDHRVRRLLPLPLTAAATARATTPAVPSPPTIVAVLDTEAPKSQAA